MTFVIVGPHGVGKSTLGKRVAALCGIPFHDELGYRLTRNRAASAKASDAQVDVDHDIFAHELARDAAWVPERHRIVESWHPGNLSYACRRSASVVQRYWWAVTHQAALLDAVCLPLDAADDVLRSRQHEPGDPAFFHAVGREAAHWALRIGMPCMAVTHTDSLSIDATAERLANFILHATQTGFPWC